MGLKKADKFIFPAYLKTIFDSLPQVWYQRVIPELSKPHLTFTYIHGAIKELTRSDGCLCAVVCLDELVNMLPHFWYPLNYLKYQLLTESFQVNFSEVDNKNCSLFEPIKQKGTTLRLNAMTEEGKKRMI